MFFVVHTHILPAMLETSFLAHTHGGKNRALKKLCPVKLNGLLQVTMGFQNPRDFQGAILTWHDYSAVTPSTFDSKTWTTASAVVTLLGCLCLLGFTETIPMSFKNLFRFAFLNSNKTKTLYFAGDLIMHPQKRARASTSPMRTKRRCLENYWLIDWYTFSSPHGAPGFFCRSSKTSHVLSVPAIYYIYIHIPFAEIMMPGLCDTLTISQPSQLTFLFWLGSWFA